MGKQLEVAWQLCSVLRDRLVTMEQTLEEAHETPVEEDLHLPKATEAPPRPKGPDVLAAADALVATARAVTAAAQAAQVARAGLGHSPPSSPRCAVEPTAFAPVAA